MPVATELEKLIIEGEKIEQECKGENFEEKFRQKCMTILRAKYGTHSQQEENFRSSRSLEVAIAVLKILAAEERKKEENPNSALNITLNQTQITSVHQQIEQQFLLNIEYANITKEEKDEAKQLFAELQQEMQKPDTNWEKVKGFLKQSLDYGFKIAIPIMQMVTAYYQTKPGI